MIFVPPLLFSSLLQVAIDQMEKDSVLNIHFKIDKEYILFSCTGSYINSEDLEKTEQRLRFLYKDGYTISLNNNLLKLKIKI